MDTIGILISVHAPAQIKNAPTTTSGTALLAHVSALSTSLPLPAPIRSSLMSKFAHADHVFMFSATQASSGTLAFADASVCLIAARITKSGIQTFAHACQFHPQTVN